VRLRALPLNRYGGRTMTDDRNAQPDPARLREALDALARARDDLIEADREAHAAITAARDAGMTWRQIAEATGWYAETLRAMVAREPGAIPRAPAGGTPAAPAPGDGVTVRQVAEVEGVSQQAIRARIAAGRYGEEGDQQTGYTRSAGGRVTIHHPETVEMVRAALTK